MDQSINNYQNTIGTEAYQPLSSFINKIKTCQSNSIPFAGLSPQSSPSTTLAPNITSVVAAQAVPAN